MTIINLYFAFARIPCSLRHKDEWRGEHAEAVRPWADGPGVTGYKGQLSQSALKDRELVERPEGRLFMRLQEKGE